MRNLKKHIVEFLLLTLGLSGCGVGKTMTKKSARHSETRESEMKSHVSKDESSSRYFTFTDSGRHHYKVTIFPIDSFSFSEQNGFQGRARIIELSGVEERKAQGNIFEMKSAKMISDSVQSVSESTKKVEHSHSREVRRSKGHIFIFVTAAIALLVVLWKFGRFKIMQ